MGAIIVIIASDKSRMSDWEREQLFALKIKHLYSEHTLGNAGKQVDGW